MGITLLLFLLTNTSLRSEFLSVLAITSSTVRLLTWITQTCLMYILHWRAIQSSWLNLRSFWAVWFLTSCITTISFLNILLSDVTAKPDVIYRQIYFSIIAVQGLASSGLAICIFLPNDIGDYSSILKYISSNQYDAIESGSSNNITGSLNAPFLRNGINSNYNHYNNAGHGVIHSPTRKYTSYNGRNVQFQEESKKMSNNNENSSYAKTQPISTNVNYSNENDSYLSQSNGSQSGISLEQNASLKTKNKKKNDILKKKGKKNKKRDLKERNIWDSFMEHATSKEDNEDYQDNTTTTTTPTTSTTPHLEENDDFVSNTITNTTNTPTKLNNNNNTNITLEHTIFTSIPMTVYVPSWYIDPSDGHIEYDIVIFATQPYLQQFLQNQNLPLLQIKQENDNNTNNSNNNNNNNNNKTSYVEY